MSPQLSIGLPVYNGRPYVEVAIKALLAQTFQDIEIVIVDNASDDGTWDLCERFAAQDSRVKLTRQATNVGAAANYNQAFHNSSGKYFKWATADDVCLPEFAEQCILELDRDPEVALCYPQTYLIDASGGNRRPYEDGLRLNHASPSHRLDTMLRRIDLANPVFGVFRREILAQTRLIGNYPMSDLVLLAEVALRGRFAESTERLFLRRMHPQQSIQKYKNRQERAQWFQPGRPPGRFFPCWRLLLEFAKAIHAAPLQTQQRIACYASLRHWLRRYWKDHFRDLRGGSKQLLASAARRTFHGAANNASRSMQTQ